MAKDDPAAAPGVFRVVCPCCSAALWIDSGTRSVLRSEKAKKAKGSLDDLLAKEHERQEQLGRKLEAGFELQRSRHEHAEETFREAFHHAEEEGPEEGAPAERAGRREKETGED